MARQLRPVDLKILSALEGRIPYVYDDAIAPTRPYQRGEPIRGTLTGGVGHAARDVMQWIGRDIPDAQIDKWLDEDTNVAEAFVENTVLVPLNANQYAALVFWVFNIGVGAAGKSTLLRKLNTGDYASVPAQLRRWNMTTIDNKKVVSDGLVKRREHEVQVWLAAAKDAPIPQARPDNQPIATEVGEPEAPKTTTKENVSWGVGIITMLISSATEGPISYVLAGCMGVAFGVGLYWFVTKRLFPR